MRTWCSANGPMEPRTATAVVAALLAVLSVSACKELETETVAGYEPSHIEPIKGSDDLKRVTFTKEGARRTGLKTTPVRRNGEHTVVPYGALIYDPEGKIYVYASPEPLSFVRKEIDLDRIVGDRVFLTDGPPVGTEVVTVGTAEVYGTELEVASH